MRVTLGCIYQDFLSHVCQFSIEMVKYVQQQLLPAIMKQNGALINVVIPFMRG